VARGGVYGEFGVEYGSRRLAVLPGGKTAVGLRMRCWTPERAWGASSRDVTLNALTGVPEQHVSKRRVRSGLHRPELSQLRVCWTLISSRVLEAGSHGTGYGNGGTVAVSEALPTLRLC
jgi:hypothetical protein